MPAGFLPGALALSIALASSLSLAAPPGTESYEGFDVERLAEATARLSALRTQHGERQGNEAFAGWLAGEGLSRPAYDRAYAAFWERFRADPSGQLEARFHRILREWSQELHYGDAKDWRKETREGVSLDTYAKVCVALTRQQGAKLEDVLKTHGIAGTERWRKVNEAWTKAMKDDTTSALVQQYGALYQKYAGPQFAAEQDAVTANALSRRPTPPPATPPPAPETLDQVAARMASAQGRERMEAAREYAHACDLWSGPARKDPKDARAARCATSVLERDLAPVLLESLERADDKTNGFAVRLADYLDELDLKTPGAKLTLQRVLNRCQERLATLEASFAPIKDKAVPERVPLRSKIEEYQAAVTELKRMLAAW